MAKLLFDANISHRVKKHLRQSGQEVYHVSDFTKTLIPDNQIWNLAKTHSCIIVTYDKDFVEIQALRGYPPKIIWLRFGNKPTVYIANKILLHEKQIKELLASDELGILEIN